MQCAWLVQAPFCCLTILEEGYNMRIIMLGGKRWVLSGLQ